MIGMHSGADFVKSRSAIGGLTDRVGTQKHLHGVRRVNRECVRIAAVRIRQQRVPQRPCGAAIGGFVKTGVTQTAEGGIVANGVGAVLEGRIERRGTGCAQVGDRYLYPIEGGRGGIRQTSRSYATGRERNPGIKRTPGASAVRSFEYA